MKKILMVALTLILVLSLAACGGGGGGGDNGGSAGGGGGAAAPTAAGDDDPCPCCPDCIQAECVCEECGGNDDYDCKCSAPGGGGPFTFLVEIDTNFVGSLGQVYRTIGEATVILDESDSSGWFGSAEGYGIYTDWGHPDYVEVDGGSDFNFTARLSNYDPLKGDSIMFGTNRFCAEDGFLMMSFEFHRMDLYDGATGLYTFEIPMENGIAKLVDHWKEPPPGLIVIDMTITVTRLD